MIHFFPVLIISILSIATVELKHFIHYLIVKKVKKDFDDDYTPGGYNIYMLTDIAIILLIKFSWENISLENAQISLFAKFFIVISLAICLLLIYFFIYIKILKLFACKEKKVKPQIDCISGLFVVGTITYLLWNTF